MWLGWEGTSPPGKGSLVWSGRGTCLGCGLNSAPGTWEAAYQSFSLTSMFLPLSTSCPRSPKKIFNITIIPSSHKFYFCYFIYKNLFCKRIWLFCTIRWPANNWMSSQIFLFHRKKIRPWNSGRPFLRSWTDCRNFTRNTWRRPRFMWPRVRNKRWPWVSRFSFTSVRNRVLEKLGFGEECLCFQCVVYVNNKQNFGG